MSAAEPVATAPPPDLAPVALIGRELVDPTSLGPPLAAAAGAGLDVLAAAAWPETTADDEVTPLAGFIESAFSPLLAEVAARALRRRPEPAAPGPVIAVVMVTALGDVTSATGVAAAVDAGRRISPLLFFQSVPNAVAGYLAARWDLTGPVVCVSELTAGLDIAALLIDDGDADEALVVDIDLAVAVDGLDRAVALLVTRPDRPVVTTADLNIPTSE